MLGELAEIASLVHIYIREAHPVDEWHMGSNDPSSKHPEGLCFQQPTNIAGRIEIARKMVSDCGLTAQVLCDSIKNEADSFRATCPDRLFVLRGGRIVFKGGPGPFLYDVEELYNFLRAFRHHG
ncbi:iodothyronine deiodinase [Pavlovales sp. CCMP2436]|nr:iodothyronine deiodinase [Pavlovales sp. CCMP2436]|mmetsp:Transcript_26637/g.62298  ORF Transcript_26637/g.62298 Transcript_26637/m.62298 type:complete len:124 (+) Transcript_26637:215-586(+)